MDKRKTETEKQYKSDLRSWATLRAETSDQLPKIGAFIVGDKEPLLKHYAHFIQSTETDGQFLEVTREIRSPLEEIKSKEGTVAINMPRSKE